MMGHGRIKNKGKERGPEARRSRVFRGNVKINIWTIRGESYGFGMCFVLAMGLANMPGCLQNARFEFPISRGGSVPIEGFPTRGGA